jgi:hypothetical protein
MEEIPIGDSTLVVGDRTFLVKGGDTLAVYINGVDTGFSYTANDKEKGNLSVSFSGIVEQE